MSIATGTILRNRYKILGELGSGGFGETYLAQDLDLPGQPQCVVKHLKTHPASTELPIVRRLFDSEAETLHQLGRECNRIPQLFAYFEKRGQFYLVQEFVAGEDLSGELTDGKKLGEFYVRRLLQDILEVVDVAHQHRVIHRDIKPANLIRRQEDGKIVLIDFGAVKQVGTTIVNASGQTRVSIAIGTLGYMPSEQAIGKPKLCSDIYAVGTIGIQALTGMNPINLPDDPNTGEVVWRDRATVSDELADILDRMVRQNWVDRYKNAAEVLEQLNPPQPISQKLFSQPLPSPSPVKAFPGLSQQSFETVTVNARGEIIDRRQCWSQVWEEDLGNGEILEMVKISGGQFLMGSPETEAGRDEDEGPQHWVTVPEFFMGKYPVTQAQWRAVAELPRVSIDLDSDPSRFKGNNRPVEKVSWDQATEFCQRLSRATGRDYHLPSEAQWEYACRAGTTTPFYFGETITTDLANYWGNYTYGLTPMRENRHQTKEVGSFAPNAFGLYDLHGNLWEWCADDWHENYDRAPSDGSIWLSSKDERPRKVLRGGSWSYIPDYCRSAYRGDCNPAGVLNDIGLRVLYAVPGI